MDPRRGDIATTYCIPRRTRDDDDSLTCPISGLCSRITLSVGTAVGRGSWAALGGGRRATPPPPGPPPFEAV